MAKRTHRRSSSVARLRLAIDCLPVDTREAMLEGVRSSERIIAGAYVDRDGGVCPMLAAHRRGSRVDFLSFAKSWDRFTTAARGPRTASRRQVAILVGLLEESLEDSTGLELDRAISEHRALRSARLHRSRRTLGLGDPSGTITARRLRLRRRVRRSEPPAALAPKSRARELVDARSR